jgi:hypothetical protein
LYRIHPNKKWLKEVIPDQGNLGVERSCDVTCDLVLTFRVRIGFITSKFCFAYMVPGLFLFATVLAAPAPGATKPHAVSFGKWTAIKWCVGENESKCLDLRVRALSVDNRAREFTVGTPHDTTERGFVVRRAFRVNDSLPGETASPARWVWQRGG